MRYPFPLRRLGATPGLLRLVCLFLECLSIVILGLRHRHDVSYTTDYLIVSLLSVVQYQLHPCIPIISRLGRRASKTR